MNPVTYLLINSLSRTSQIKINPVLGGVRDAVIANQLRRGMLDSEMVRTRELYQSELASCTGLRNWQLCELPREQLTDEVINKRQIVKARARGFAVWKSYTLYSYLAMKDFVADDELYIADEIEKSSAGNPSQGLIDYAHAADLPIAEAFEYLKLYVDERKNQRLILHAVADKVARLLNASMNENEIDDIIAEMPKLFYGRKRS